MDNLGEMNKFLEIYTLPKLNQEEAKNLNRSITNEVEAVIKKKKKPPSKQKSWTRWLHRQIYPTFKEELTPILLKIFQKIQEVGRLPSCFYKTSITLIPKPGKPRDI